MSPMSVGKTTQVTKATKMAAVAVPTIRTATSNPVKVITKATALRVLERLGFAPPNTAVSTDVADIRRSPSVKYSSPLPGGVVLDDTSADTRMKATKNADTAEKSTTCNLRPPSVRVSKTAPEAAATGRRVHHKIRQPGHGPLDKGLRFMVAATQTSSATPIIKRATILAAAVIAALLKFATSFLPTCLQRGRRRREELSMQSVLS